MNWEPIKPISFERLVDRYEYLVAQVEQGYGMCIYEYTNDLACRIKIQERLEIDSDLEERLLLRLKQADTKLKTNLLSTCGSIYGSYPQSYFWFYGIPKNSPELIEDAKGLGMLP